MALVAVATGAAGLDPQPAITGVSYTQNMALVEGRMEAGPARAALELGLSLEQGQAAETAAVDAVLLVVQKTATERGFGAVMQQDLGLFAAEAAFQTLAFRCVGGCQIKSGGGGGWLVHVVHSKVFG